MKDLVYDLEIKRAILGKNEMPQDGIDYDPAGWKSSNLGISSLCAYSYHTGLFYLFADDNIGEFQAIVNAHDRIVSFNGISFDNPQAEANGISIAGKLQYDILVEMWIAAGLAPKFEYPSHIGFGLDATLKTNFDLNKINHGANAPVLFQRGQWGALLNYNLHDVQMTKRLFDLIFSTQALRDPREPANWLKLRNPKE